MADVQDDMLDLAGCWQVATADGSHSTAISIPGDVHSALQQAGIIPDPYAGRNEELVQWVAHEDWVLEREFELTDASGRWYLDIDYLDTVATVFVNDIEVLSADNCFRRFRPDVSKALKIGPNSLRIVIHSSIRAGAERQAAQPFYVPYSTGNSPIPNGNMLRKPQCHFGWDWNIALAPLGLYGTIALKRLDDARIEHVTTRQHHNDDGSVDVEVTVTLHAADPCIVPLHLAFGDEALRLDCGMRPGENTVTHLFHLDSPRLWWPVGSGEQVLYMLSVEVPSERVTKRIGLRQVELLTTPDAAGSRFAFRVNGREIFCRGANWIPADALFSRSSPERTEALLQSAVDAHMNMIRVWGGGFYEQDWFYDLCDRMGLMVWQDFMFACNLYPCTEDFLENVAHEVEYQVKRLSSHPSITLWCGDNELVGALTWFPESRTNRDRYLVAYDRLNRVIEQQMKKAAPDGLWWPSSPASGYLDYGDAWHADGSGDMHYWSVWHENKSFDEYRSVRPRFCSEFGFQSYTSLPVIRSFAGEGDLNIASPVMELHQKNVGGNERIAGTMFRYFRFPTSFAGFVYLSQVQQALAIRTAVDYWRSLKPHCMGTLYWQLNDTWPVASWASLDHGGRWKAMHYLARRFFQPVTLAVIPEGEAFAVSAVNDTADAVGIEAEFFLLSLTGERTPLHRLSGPCSPDRAEKLFEIPRSEVPPQSVLAWRFTASNGMAGEGHIVPDTYKALDLKPSGLTHSVTAAEDGQWEIAVTAEGLALFVMIESETDGRYADNLFDLAGGESRRIRFTPTAALPPGAVPQFRVTDLHLAQA
ncbi:glycoside hydrolase family 2 protein [Rhizobium sp. YJ-22]|uniref:beta-mannosidase n=1 Tax=Rhizobium sp. YJ-22 TaxID=3037556 RepID=UPI00241263FA|nr:glycoside hydrolase family 2 protein [Rhizobium sp. YJ-22]MDG3575751.1 glycoside hydrolase family 2 protein [Rhizobium sp. YJ-22]